MYSELPHGNRCGAKAKSTGKPCMRYKMPNGKCYMHGGATPIKTGLHTNKAKAERKAVNQLVRESKALIKEGRVG